LKLKPPASALARPGTRHRLMIQAIDFVIYLQKRPAALIALAQPLLQPS
jgi:hypothetical protein